jgi:hypothetical protein
LTRPETGGVPVASPIAAAPPFDRHADSFFIGG